MKKLTFIFVMALLLIVLVGCSNNNSQPVQSTILVEQIAELDSDFIMGVDVSSVISLENSGVVFRDFAGKKQDIFATLKQAGVNYIRVRLWNDPFDANGNSYGGGVCDIDTAVAIGKRATKNGMKLLVDFHYSDFWTDPAKQQAPKAWQGMNIDDKADALGEYTLSALNKLAKENIDIGMVQLGNEITTGLAGETTWQNICQLLNAGVAGVKQADDSLPIAMHFTNPQNANQYQYYASVLQEYDVTYDVFATSYYPYWHGTLDNLSSVLSQVSQSYNKQVMVAEISYAKDIVDTDCHPNTITSADNMPYPISVQGQATAVAETIETVASIQGGIGIFYWEPAWIGVGTDWQCNHEKWELYGSGWASSYAVEYDTSDAGRYYGGSAWENQAMFDDNGVPLESLNVFKYVYTGTVLV